MPTFAKLSQDEVDGLRRLTTAAKHKGMTLKCKRAAQGRILFDVT